MRVRVRVCVRVRVREREGGVETVLLFIFSTSEIRIIMKNLKIVPPSWFAGASSADLCNLCRAGTFQSASGKTQIIVSHFVVFHYTCSIEYIHPFLPIGLHLIIVMAP